MQPRIHQPIRKTYHRHHPTYYSKTQANFFKAYAQQFQFINKLKDLLNAIDKRKVIRITQQVKLGNQSFKKYLNQKKIVYLKIQDVIGFEEMIEKHSNQTTINTQQSERSSNRSPKENLFPSFLTKSNKKLQHPMIVLMRNFSTLRKPKPQYYSAQQRQMIKKGFMTLLQKLETLKKDEFINETGYLQGVLVRESEKIKNYWSQNGQQHKQLQKGRKINVKKLNLVQEIDHEQKLNGLYPLIMKNVREQTFAIEHAQSTFSLLMQH